MNASAAPFISSPFEHPFVHLMAEGYGLSDDDTHFRYVDEFKSAELAKNLDPPAATNIASTQRWATIRAALAINVAIMLGIFSVAAIASIELV